MAEFKLQTLRRLSTAVLIHSPCQCDQIGRKFSTLAISVSLFGIWQNIKPTFVNILCLRAKIIFFNGQTLNK